MKTVYIMTPRMQSPMITINTLCQVSSLKFLSFFLISSVGVDIFIGVL